MIEDKHWKILIDILNRYPYQFYVFGSRIKGTAKKYSDLDLCYKEEVPYSILSNIKETLEETNLPFSVDFVDWNNCTEDFQKLIENDLIPLQNLKK